MISTGTMIAYWIDFGFRLVRGMCSECFRFDSLY
jgi:hypothetical protein